MRDNWKIECDHKGSLLHYTDIDAFSHIIQDKTLKCSSLNNVNDKFEKERTDLEEFAGTRFVTCFCNLDYEVVPFWYLYGKGKCEEKVMLRFDKYLQNLEEIIDTQRGTIFGTSEKIHFQINKSEKYRGNDLNIMSINLFDIQYVERNDPVITKSHAEYIGGNWIDVDMFQSKKRIDASDLGRQKTKNWEYEHETRLLYKLNLLDNEENIDALLIGIKPKLFEKLVVVLNPWATDEFEKKVKKIIKDADIPDNIKKTIKVNRSELDGELIENPKDNLYEMGEDRVNRLIQKLLESDRTEDITKAVKDREYQEILFRDFGL